MANRRRWTLGAAAAALAAALLLPGSVAAQPPGVHYQHHGYMPPGAIGQYQLQRGGPIPGYFQPVEITAPSGARIALAENGRFTPGAPSVRVGLLIGQVYRLRITNIPLAAGEEVYPTLELIDRTYPPPGEHAAFPIQVEIADDDLRHALAGRFVVRVTYLEDPQRALPVASGPQQEWFDVGPGDDPLLVADALGRPVAILRMGSRVPSNPDEPGLAFLYGCPPLVRLPPRDNQPAPETGARLSAPANAWAPATPWGAAGSPGPATTWMPAANGQPGGR